MRITAIVQARMGSTRLPGKPMLSLAGRPMLGRVVTRLKRAKTVHEVVVATSTRRADDPIATFCEANGHAHFRGSEGDVLDRYYRAAEQFQADVVVRITADCPLIDPDLVDRVVSRYLQSEEVFDYVSEDFPRPTFPRGLDTEVIRFSALQKAWEEASKPSWREHVTSYIRFHPEIFHLGGVQHSEDLSHMRWTVDTPEDFRMVQKVFEHYRDDRFAWSDVVRLLRANPDWEAINRDVKQKEVL